MWSFKEPKPMPLLIDIGNSTLKWQHHQPHQIATMYSARHTGKIPLDLLAAWEQLPEIDAVVYATVGPTSVATAMTQVAQAYWRCPVHEVVVDPSCGRLQLAYSEPNRFGVDRWLALLAADALPGTTAKLIIDAGTAITYDVLTATGHHLGGAILPGLTALRETLFAKTTIPAHDQQETTHCWGTSTGTAIAAACLHAPAALAMRLYHQLQKTTESDPDIVLTGGDAERLMPVINEPVHWIPDLVLQGLAWHLQHRLDHHHDKH
jgi:type III pantothenate kinase